MAKCINHEIDALSALSTIILIQVSSECLALVCVKYDHSHIEMQSFGCRGQCSDPPLAVKNESDSRQGGEDKIIQHHVSVIFSKRLFCVQIKNISAHIE